MQSHNGNEPEDHKPEEIDTSLGYEKSDVRVTGIIVFLTAMSIFVAVVSLLAYGVGKVIDTHLAKEDGPRTKWAAPVDVRQLGNLPSNPEMQNRMAELTERFPMPRLQTDNGDSDLAALHAREDLLIDNYSWIDESKGTVRIPIERAMELIAQRGLPVAPPVKTEPLMTGDAKPTITMPLTNGFAPTGYEQQQVAMRDSEPRQIQ
jgi:hypothetical protein